MASPKRNANRRKFNRQPLDIDDLTNAPSFSGIRDVIESHFGRPDTADPSGEGGSSEGAAVETDPSKLQYVWEPKGVPFSVRLDAELIERLEKESLDIFRAITNRGSEIGGILLGHVVPGWPLSVLVEDYEPVACGYTLGPSYVLSEEEQDQLDETIERRTTAGGLSVVGFFRSNTRPSLILHEDDLDLFENFFPEDHCIFLLAKPFSRKPCQGAIFVREGGKIRTEESPQEFAFSRAELEKAQALQPSIRLASPGRVGPASTGDRVAPIPIAPAASEPKRPPVVQPAPPAPRPEPKVQPTRQWLKSPGTVPPRPAFTPGARIETRVAPTPAPAAPPPAARPADPPAAAPPPRPAFTPGARIETRVAPTPAPSAPPPAARPAEPPAATPPPRPAFVPGPRIETRVAPPPKPSAPPPAPPPRPPVTPAARIETRVAPPPKPPAPPPAAAVPPRPPTTPPARIETRVAPPPTPPAASAPPRPPAPAPIVEAPVAPPPTPSGPARFTARVQSRLPASVQPRVEVNVGSKPSAEPAPVEPEKPEVTRVEPAGRAKQAEPAAPPVEEAPADDLQSVFRRKPEPQGAVQSVPSFGYEEEAPSGKRRWILPAAIALAIVVLGVYFLVIRPNRQPVEEHPDRAAHVTARPPAITLALRAEGSATGLTIFWDGEAPPISTAPRGTLSVRDGAATKNFDLTADELKQGTYQYKPHTDDVLVRLELSGLPGGQTASGGTRILGARRLGKPAK
jgi:hypothetical protein